ncbi:MAG: hypothetical protein ABH849_02470 [Nanoarchaeota archaeon]
MVVKMLKNMIERIKGIGKLQLVGLATLALLASNPGEITTRTIAIGPFDTFRIMRYKYMDSIFPVRDAQSIEGLRLADALMELSFTDTNKDYQISYGEAMGAFPEFWNVDHFPPEYYRH